MKIILDKEEKPNLISFGQMVANAGVYGAEGSEFTFISCGTGGTFLVIPIDAVMPVPFTKEKSGGWGDHKFFLSKTSITLKN